MVPLSFAPMEFAGQEWALGRCGALWWPREAALVVADLHLEKASWYASRGQMLPPYDSRATLDRLAGAIGRTGARRVYCLGDSFHDAAGPTRLEPHACGMLAALTRVTDWVWITGNHDESLLADAGERERAGGTFVRTLSASGVTLVHEATAGAAEPELSGHFHPKIAVTARGRHIARPCAVRSETRLVLPAFGALTGGLYAGHPAIGSALQPCDAIDAVLSAGERLLAWPLWRSGRPVARA